MGGKEAMISRAVRVNVYGRVQGVYFRYHTKLTADRLGLSGWVRNRRDGSVEALISGNSSDVKEMIDWLHYGPDRAVVHKVQITEVEDDESLSSEFLIRY